MYRSLLTIAATFASSALVQGLGVPSVHNHCEYEVYIRNTPADGNGLQETDYTLAPGETWTGNYMPTKVGGVSIKVSKTAGQFGAGYITQFEYTYQNDGQIWFDISQVDGNIFDPWYIASDDLVNCPVKQQAYRAWNDDAYGMQGSCDPSVSISYGIGENDASASEGGTGTGTGTGTDSGSSSEASSSPAQQQQEPASSTSSSTPSPVASAAAVVSDTSDTSDSSDFMDTNGHVGNGATTMVTQIVTVTEGQPVYHTHWVKRHEHHHHKRAF